MKRIVFPLLGMLMLGFSGCIKPGENKQCTNYYMPAFYNFSYEPDLFQPVFITQSGIFVNQESAELTIGEAYLIAFCVNYDQQASTQYTTVYNLDCIPVGRGYTQPTDGGHSVADDFDLPITAMEYIGRVGNVIFFAFAHENNSNQGFIYEMTYDSNATDDPTVYCRAKYAGLSLANSVKVGYYAFNMNTFFYDHIDAYNKVKFKVKFKTGKDEEGNDKYGSVNSGNAVEIDVIGE